MRLVINTIYVRLWKEKDKARYIPVTNNISQFTRRSSLYQEYPNLPTLPQSTFNLNKSILKKTNYPSSITSYVHSMGDKTLEKDISHVQISTYDLTFETNKSTKIKILNY